MLISVNHETRYRYDAPAVYTIQSLKLTPQNTTGQRVLSWSIDCGQDGPIPSFTDSFGNLTHTLVINREHSEVLIRVTGRVETKDTAGIVAGTWEPFPLVAYLRETELTRPDDALRDLAWSVGQGHTAPLDLAHALMAAVRDRIDYREGLTRVETTAAEALALGYGVCQDHAHAFICCARLRGIPARYVSGYLQAGDGEGLYEAGHAWAEAHIPGLGWVGFDVANRLCPSEAHLRMAVGLDYREAAPIRGLRLGGGTERLDVTVRVVQESSQQ